MCGMEKQQTNAMQYQVCLVRVRMDNEDGQGNVG